MKKWRFDKFFLLTWKKTAIALIVFVLSVIIHNFSSVCLRFLFGVNVEDALFFIIAVFGVPAYFVISIVYTLIKRMRKKK